MAKLTLNSALQGIRGRIDNWVYRKYGSRTVLARRPEFSGPPSAAQLMVREKFRAAAVYAKAALADPVARAVYQVVAEARGLSLFALVVSDYLKAPVVEAIDTTGYHGLVGQSIKVMASDDFAVVGVTVAIRDAADELIEQGPAVLAGGQWTYTATAAVPAQATVAIEATATDRPGHTGVKIVPWINA